MQEIREVSPRFDAMHSNATHGDFYGFRNMEQLSENPVEMDFDILRRLKQNYPSKVVVASIMGQVESEWVELAKMAEEAGCDAIELNFSCPQMKHKGMGSDGGHQAIVFDAETRTPRLVGSKCVGCHLCRIVCPTGAIGVTRRVPRKS